MFGDHIDALQARLSAAEEALRQQAIYNDSYADLQARLSATETVVEETYELLTKTEAELKRAEEVIEAAKKSVEMQLCTGRLAAAIRQYEEGQALPHGHGGVLPSTRDVMYPREEGK